jgi:hypothetical protein
MVSVPNPRTWVDREIPPYSTINAEVYGTLAWLLQPPMCKIRQTTAQSLTTATFTAITFQTEDIDPYNWHGTTNPTRITPTFPGWYRGWYSVGMTTQTGGLYRVAYLGKNGGGTIARSRRDSKPPISAGNKSLRGIPFFLPMNGTTDYFEVYAYQDCGSTMVLPVLGYLNSEFFCRWWGPL